MVEIVLPWPPSVNHYWRTWQGRTTISRAGREYRQAVERLVLAYGLQSFGANSLAVSIEARMPDRRKRDLDNLLKAPLDALTHAGLWLDDSQIHDLRITRAPIVKGGALTVRVEDRTC